MCDTNMHLEALRKKRVLERKALAQQNLRQQQVEDIPVDLDYQRQAQMAGAQSLGLKAMKAEQNRLTKFRVNDEGFQNRYRARAELAPHVDRMYAIIYPGGDNSDYTADTERNERIQNRAESAYDARQRVNGHVDLPVMVDVLPCALPE